MTSETITLNLVGFAGTTTFDATIEHLPEDVWLVTSDEVPSLIVEAGSRSDAIHWAEHLAPQFMEEDGR